MLVYQETNVIDRQPDHAISIFISGAQQRILIENTAFIFAPGAKLTSRSQPNGAITCRKRDRRIIAGQSCFFRVDADRAVGRYFGESLVLDRQPEIALFIFRDGFHAIAWKTVVGGQDSIGHLPHSDQPLRLSTEPDVAFAVFTNASDIFSRDARDRDQSKIIDIHDLLECVCGDPHAAVLRRQKVGDLRSRKAPIRSIAQKLSLLETKQASIKRSEPKGPPWQLTDRLDFPHRLCIQIITTETSIFPQTEDTFIFFECYPDLVL